MQIFGRVGWGWGGGDISLKMCILCVRVKKRGGGRGGGGGGGRLFEPFCVFGSCFRTLAVILFQIVIRFYFIRFGRVR